MKIFKEIFGRIWMLWGFVVFVVTILTAYFFYLPGFFMNEPAASRWHRHISRGWMWVLINLIGCRLKVKGLSFFEKGKNYVIVCNHNSMMDIVATTPFMANPNKTIAKKSLASIPVFGWIYGEGSILVDRGSDRSRKKSYEEMKNVLQKGLDMVIYPEGTRNRSDKPLKPFYDGAFKLAVDAKKDIIPTLIFHTRKVLPADKPLYLWPHKLEMHFLPPVKTENVSAKELKEKIFKMMWDYYEANNCTE